MEAPENIISIHGLLHEWSAIPVPISRELNSAIDAIWSASAIIKSYARRPIQASLKGSNDASALDYVTEVDLLIESAIIESLQKVYPDDGFVAEEGGVIQSDNGNRWLIDPIDGSLNLMRGLPFYTISVALERKGEIMCGVIFNPTTGNLYLAEKGKGAYRNGMRLSCAQRTDYREMMLACTLDKRLARRSELLRVLDYLGGDYLSLICLQSSTITLCLLAEGKIDAVIDWGCIWDVAAAQLIAAESGAVVTGWKGEPLHASEGYVLAGNPTLHAHLLPRLHSFMEKRR